MKKASTKVSIFEVGPRDGLQSENVTLSLAERERLIDGLVAAGLEDIEVGSFVRTDRIPQLAQSGELVRTLRKKYPKGKGAPRFWAFVPNERGLQDAAESGVDGVAFFASVSDTFAHKNVNASREELLKRIDGLIPLAKKAKLKHRVYVSTMHYCPFEGEMKDAELLKVVSALLTSGAQEIALSDTTGHSLPHRIEKTLSLVLKKCKPGNIALHLHDTRALALSNVLAALPYGISRFDSSFGGLGGCPYAPGAAGNLATEDLVYFLAGEKRLGAKVNLTSLAEVSKIMEGILKRPLPSKVLKTLGGQSVSR